MTAQPQCKRVSRGRQTQKRPDGKIVEEMVGCGSLRRPPRGVRRPAARSGGAIAAELLDSIAGEQCDVCAGIQEQRHVGDLGEPSGPATGAAPAVRRRPGLRSGLPPPVAPASSRPTHRAGADLASGRVNETHKLTPDKLSNQISDAVVHTGQCQQRFGAPLPRWMRWLPVA